MIAFEKQLISLERFESAAFVDVDCNGVMDIVSGAWWYQGPDFKTAHRIYTPPAEGEYYDDFSTIAMDVTGNGFPDIITGGWWGGALRILENPGASGGLWNVNTLENIGNIETSIGVDIDGDGVIEMIPNTPNSVQSVYKLEDHKLVRYIVGDSPTGHGLGTGDLAGNGRMDIILCNGWLENPGSLTKKWNFHPDFKLSPWTGVPVLAVDLDDDGEIELISGSGHNYGLSYFKRESGVWREHVIDPWNAQYHCLRWVDIDGDGKMELVTGKRHRAHCGNDPGENDPAGIYYFKFINGQFVKQVIDYGPNTPLSGKGCGIQFDLFDLEGNGFLSVIAPGKDGLFLYRNTGDRETQRMK